MRRRKGITNGIKITIIEHRTRWEALDLLLEVQEAMIANRPGKVCTLLGMVPDLFEELTIDELADVIKIRVSSLAKEAGVKIEEIA